MKVRMHGFLFSKLIRSKSLEGLSPEGELSGLFVFWRKHGKDKFYNK